MDNGMVALTLKVAPWNAKSLTRNMDGTRYNFRVFEKTMVPAALAEELLNTKRGEVVAGRPGGVPLRVSAFERWATREVKKITPETIEHDMEALRVELAAVQEKLLALSAVADGDLLDPNDAPEVEDADL